MTTEQTIEILSQYAAWRKGADIEPPSVLHTGMALEMAIEKLKQETEPMACSNCKHWELVTDKRKWIAEGEGICKGNHLMWGDKEVNITVDCVDFGNVDDIRPMPNFFCANFERK